MNTRHRRLNEATAPKPEQPIDPAKVRKAIKILLADYTRDELTELRQYIDTLIDRSHEPTN